MYTYVYIFIHIYLEVYIFRGTYIYIYIFRNLHLLFESDIHMKDAVAKCCKPILPTDTYSVIILFPPLPNLFNVFLFESCFTLRIAKVI